MTISKDLFLAILSLDSYNRGYGVGLVVAGAKVGSATIGLTSTDAEANIPDGQTAGFYAISYKVGTGVEGIADGTTVIAYRGTDQPNPFTAGSDVVHGWLAATGLPTSQTNLTLDFYKAVTKKSVYEGKAENTILTGHSLGGGLAGLASALSGTQGHGYDYMPFGLIAYKHYAEHINNGGTAANYPGFSAFTGTYTEGEALQAGREGTAQGVLRADNDNSAMRMAS